MNLYKREGRRFVKTTVCDNIGKYYQKDGSFVEERTKDSIGLCIISTPKEHVVMSLTNYLEYESKFGHAELKAALMFDGKGEIPKLQELMIALILFKEELNIDDWKNIWNTEPMTSEPYIAHAYPGGGVGYGAVVEACRYAWLRPIVRIPQI